MEKNKLNVILAVFLVTVCVLIFIRNIFLSHPAVHSPQPVAAEETPILGGLTSLVNMRQNDAIYWDQWKRWEGDWGRDPFMPEATMSAPVIGTDQLVLQGIFWDETNPKALLNDKMLSKGDTLGTYKVIEIKPGSVVLQTGKKNIEVRVFQPISSKNTRVNSLSG